MKYYLVLFTVFFIASTALAQGPGTPPMMPPPGGQRMMPHQTRPDTAYADSVQFNATFKELYPLIRPTPNVQERAEATYTRMLRMFKQRGVDSAKGYDSAMAAIDKSKDQKILFKAYREAFSAEELKAMVTFFKTPAGKHYLEVESKLVDARSKAIDQYVNQTINMAVAPMEKPMERKPRPGMPGAPGAPGAPPSPGAPPVPPVPPTPPNHD
jgi:hypothetical protein